MGLTFHYSGHLSNINSVKKLTEEVKDVCINFDWEYLIWPLGKSADGSDDPDFDTSVIDTIKGISFTPPDCETIFLTFLPDGKLISPIPLIYSKGKTDFSAAHYIHTKTQYSGFDVHLALMKLLIYLEKKYFAKLKVEDEGCYWETRDELVLRNQFQRFNEILDMVANSLNCLEKKPSESTSSLADRIETLLSDLQKQQPN
ncbi:hypothetical protein BH11BAC1_BH11BAC1_20360 [soil metagenome]